MFVGTTPGLDIRWCTAPFVETKSGRDAVVAFSFASVPSRSSSEAIKSIWNFDDSYECSVFVSCQSSTGSKYGAATNDDIQITRAGSSASRA